MIKFSIVSISGASRELPYLLKELRKSNLISGTEKDAGGETVYLTNSLPAVQRIVDEYDGIMLDIHKDLT